MHQSFPVLRRAAVVVVAVLSVIGAIFLVWLATPERIGSFTNAHLVGILALILLPAVALGSWELDRRASRRRVNEPEREDEGEVRAHEVAGERERHALHRRRVKHGADERVER